MAAIVIILLMLICNYHIVKGKVIIIHDIDTGKKSKLWAPSGRFALFFIHSVQKTPVYEFFHIQEDNTLTLVETRFSSFGVGLPYTREDGKLSIKEDTMQLTLNRSFDKIPLRVSPIPEHKIIIDGNHYPLLNFTNPENLIEITASNHWKLMKR